MSHHFEPATFVPLVGTVFEVDVAGIVVPLRLFEVSDSIVRGPLRAFSIFFHGPVELELTQGNFTFRHPNVDAMTFFIVPIAESNRERIVYQASFSHVADERGQKTD